MGEGGGYIYLMVSPTEDEMTDQSPQYNGA